MSIPYEELCVYGRMRYRNNGYKNFNDSGILTDILGCGMKKKKSDGELSKDMDHRNVVDIVK